MWILVKDGERGGGDTGRGKGRRAKRVGTLLEDGERGGERKG